MVCDVTLSGFWLRGFRVWWAIVWQDDSSNSGYDQGWIFHFSLPNSHGCVCVCDDWGCFLSTTLVVGFFVAAAKLYPPPFWTSGVLWPHVHTHWISLFQQLHSTTLKWVWCDICLVRKWSTNSFLLYLLPAKVDANTCEELAKAKSSNDRTAQEGRVFTCFFVGVGRRTPNFEDLICMFCPRKSSCLLLSKHDIVYLVSFFEDVLSESKCCVYVW